MGFFIISILIAKAAVAQQSETSAWSGVQLPVSFNSKWQWHNDAGYRTIGFSGSAYQYLYRTGARYSFTKGWSAAAGAAFFFTRTSYQKADHEFGKEFRLWQELNFNKYINGKCSLQNRIRIEQRWFNATQSIETYTAFRLRYRLSGLQKLSDKWGLQLANEYMQQSVNKKFSFNQNRVIASAIYSINQFNQFQCGYMWLLWPSSSQHVMVITFQKNISVYGNGNKRSS
jgi:hypothetical protein